MGWPLGVSRPPRTAEHRRKLGLAKSAYNKTARGKKTIQKHGQKMRNWYKTEDGMKFKQGHGQKMRNWWKTEAGKIHKQKLRDARPLPQERAQKKREWYKTEDGMKCKQGQGQKMREWYETEAGKIHKQKLRAARPRWAENKNVYGAHAPPSPEKCAHAFHQDGLRPGEATLVVNLNTVWNQPTLCHFVSAGDGDQLPSLSFNLLHGDTLMFGSFVDERYLHGIPARPPDFLTSTRVSIAVTVKKTGPCIGPIFPALGSCPPGYHCIGTLALQEIMRLMLDGKYTRCTRFAKAQTSRAVIVLRGEEMRSLPTKDQEEEKGFCEEDFFSRAPTATALIEKIAMDMGGVWTRAQVNIYPSQELALQMSKASS